MLFSCRPAFLTCWVPEMLSANTVLAREAKCPGYRLCFFTARVPGCQHTAQGRQMQLKIGIPACVAPVKKQRGGWDGGCGSQIPVQPKATGDAEELGMGICRPMISQGQG